MPTTLRDFHELELLVAEGLSKEKIFSEINKPLWGSETQKFRGKDFCSKCEQLISLNYCTECHQSLPAPTDLSKLGDSNTFFDERRKLLLETVARQLSEKNLKEDLTKFILEAINFKHCAPALDDHVLNRIIRESKRRSA